MPGSSSEARSGEFGVKYGPSVCAGVGSSSPQAGVGASAGAAATAVGSAWGWVGDGIWVGASCVAGAWVGGTPVAAGGLVAGTLAGGAAAAGDGAVLADCPAQAASTNVAGITQHKRRNSRRFGDGWPSLSMCLPTSVMRNA
jgi:hypothetical protein